MTYFADSRSKIQASAKMCNITVVGLYDQGQDHGLMKLENSTGGACLALCLRWLGCAMLKQNFWETTFSGKNQLKTPGVLDRIMGWTENCDSQTREKRIVTLAGNLGLAEFQGETRSGVNWQAGMLQPKGRGLEAEVFDADCHSLFGLAEGETVTASKGEGHAIAFIRTADDSRRFFDPNFGEFLLTEWDFDLFMTQIWAQGGYDVYRSCRVRRYHPKQTG